MRRIEQAARFKSDHRRPRATPRYRALDERLAALLNLLARDISLAENWRDHPLSGGWQGCRECHVRPDLLLVYEKRDAQTLRLVRLGSHAEIFG